MRGRHDMPRTQRMTSNRIRKGLGVNLRRGGAIFFIIIGVVLQPSVLDQTSLLGTFPVWHSAWRSYFMMLSLVAFTTAMLFVLGPRLPGAKIYGWVVGFLVCFMALEMSSFTYFYITDDTFIKTLDGQMEFHPLLAAVSTPNFHVVRKAGGRDISYTHDTTSARICTEDVPRLDASWRIVAIGGSTTYDSGVDDCETWPYRLGKILGKDVAVRNLGMQGHGTAEHIIMSALILPEEHANVALYYIGWNGIHVSHVRPLRPDYSNYHFPIEYTAEEVESTYFSQFATVALLKRALVGAGFTFSPASYANYSGNVSGEADHDLLRIYIRNIKTLA